MAKISAIGWRGYFGGYDLSGDISSLGTINSSVAMQDVSDITETAMERLMLRRDGEIAINAILNNSAGRSHAVLKTLPTTDIGVMIAAGATAGDICAMLIAKQANYNYAIGADGAAALSAQALSGAGAGLEWGNSVTAGKRQDTTATSSGTGIDLGLIPGVSAVTITGATAASPTVVTTATPHGYTSGDSVVIAGASQGTLNDEWTVTVTGASTFTVPLNLGSSSTGGTVTKTSTNSGWAAQRQTFSFTGTSSTVTLQHAPKNAAASFVTITGGSFTAATALGTERITGATPAILQRYVRVITTGTFTEHTYAIGVARL